MKRKSIIILIILFVYSTYKQIAVENYILKQKEKYQILEDKERLKHLPYVLHFLKINFFQKNALEVKDAFLPYKMQNVNAFTSNKDFDRYIVYCYYSYKEIEQYNKRNPNGLDMR
ncbi:MAG: hypothetical protein QM535_00400 [Limnohabitans sp.]|nr:hypothetical protein [Limnohabitans sp.]